LRFEPPEPFVNEIPLSLMVIFIAVVFAFGALWQDSEREAPK